MKFLRPVGVIRDVKELEYVVALHQTDHSSVADFIDGSIDADDVKAFLMSRYGIDVSKDDVRRIFAGLAGGEVEEDACLDVFEMVAILVIPLLVKINNTMTGRQLAWSEQAEDEKRLQPPPDVIQDVLHTLLQDTLHSEYDAKNPPKLTAALLKKVLIAHDEVDALDDDKLIDEMVRAAGGGDGEVPLDVAAFARALTADVALYDERKETRCSTILEDVFGRARTDENLVEDKADEGTPDGAQDPATAPQDAGDGRAAGETADLKNTLSQIDFAADTQLSWEFSVVVWLVIVISYVFYTEPRVTGIPVWRPCVVADPGDSPELKEFGCQVANAIVGWIFVMLKMGILGSILGIGISTGNGTFNRTALEPILGLVAIAAFVFFPYSYPLTVNYLFKTGAVEYDDDAPTDDDMVVEEGWTTRYSVHLLPALGSVLVLLQIKNLVGLFANVDALPKRLRAFFVGSNGRAESRLKQAGIYKINEMVKHAYELHKADWKETEKTKLLKASLDYQEATKKEKVLENFSDLMDETEEVGGAIWAYKSFFSGSLQETEGIWFSTRILAAVTLMLLFTILVLVFSSLLVKDYVEVLAPPPLPPPTRSNDNCWSTFNYTECSIQPLFGFGVCRGVFYSSVCESSLEEIPYESDLFQEACIRLDQVSGGSFESLAGLSTNGSNSTCSDVLQNLSLPLLYAKDVVESTEVAYFQNESNYEDYCDTHLSYCIPFTKETVMLDDDTADNQMFEYSLATCVVGMSTSLIPFQFEGASCGDYEDINATLTFYNEQIEPQLNAVNSLYPAKWVLVLTGTVAVIVGFITALATTLVYIPSTIHTIMKFRSGVIPSLRDPNFIKYRTGLQDMAYLIGGMFWGLLISSLGMIVLVAGLVFFLTWHASRSVVLGLVAQVIGIAVTVILKIGLCKFFMKFAFAG